MHRERQHRGLALPGVEGPVVDVMVEEFELRGVRRKVPPAPLDHPPVQIDPNVPPRLRVLEDQLAGDSSTATAEVEDTFIHAGLQVWVDA